MLRALDLLDGFVGDQSLEDYRRDAMLRAAVERQFEILGEATRRLADVDPETALRIPEYKRIIAFRNVLIHGYASVEDEVVWDAWTTRTATLRAVVLDLLDPDRP